MGRRDDMPLSPSQTGWLDALRAGNVPDLNKHGTADLVEWIPRKEMAAAVWDALDAGHESAVAITVGWMRAVRISYVMDQGRTGEQCDGVPVRWIQLGRALMGHRAATWAGPLVEMSRVAVERLNIAQAADMVRAGALPSTMVAVHCVDRSDMLADFLATALLPSCEAVSVMSSAINLYFPQPFGGGEEDFVQYGLSLDMLAAFHKQGTHTPNQDGGLDMVLDNVRQQCVMAGMDPDCMTDRIIPHMTVVEMQDATRRFPGMPKDLVAVLRARCEAVVLEQAVGADLAPGLPRRM